MNQIQKIEAFGLADKYYRLCNQHPPRIGEPIENMPFCAVLKAAEGKIGINKLKGP